MGWLLFCCVQDHDVWKGAHDQEQERVQEATVMVRGGQSASSRNPAQRIPISTSMLQKVCAWVAWLGMQKPVTRDIVEPGTQGRLHGVPFFCFAKFVCTKGM